MSKKKYGKPLMIMEEFHPDSYVNNCDIIEGTILVATCANSEHRIEITMVHGNDQWEGRTDGGASSGVLYWNSKGNVWAYTGSIQEGHNAGAYPHTQGEYYNTSHPEKVGQLVEGSPFNVHYCDCQLATEAGHHHLTEKQTIKPGNHS